MELCKNFLNRSKTSYRPLACKQPVVTMREMKGTGRANKQFFFFLTKPNTIREKATIDLLYPVPFFLRNINVTKQEFTRVIPGGDTRVTPDGDTRIVVQ